MPMMTMNHIGKSLWEMEPMTQRKKWKSWGLELIEFTGSGDIDFEL